MAQKIEVVYRSIDGCRIRRTYKTVAAASAFAVKYVGETPEIGSHYAISGDGIGKITVLGATLAELFPATVEPSPAPSGRPRCTCSSHTLYHAGCSCAASDSDWETEAEEAYQKAMADAEREAAAAWVSEVDRLTAVRRGEGCTCSDQQLNLVGCDCWAEKGPF